MLFAITLNYLRPQEDIQTQLDGHKAWLVNHIKQGHILCAGPLVSGMGGFILAYGNSESEIQQMIATDPFELHQLASFNIQTIEPAIRTSQFPLIWASQAKVVEALRP